MKMSNFFLTVFFAGSVFVKAYGEEAKAPWAHESEVSIVTAGGNTSSETYSGRQKTSYSIRASKLTATGSYLEGKSSQTDSKTGVLTKVENRKWDLSARYDFSVTEKIGAFTGHGAESDPNAGFTQRDNTDLGAKYLLLKTEDKTLTAEAGFRYTKTFLGEVNSYTTFARIYAEYMQNVNKEISFKFWAEHLPNLKESEKYLTNAEASLSVVLSSIFSLKTGYNVKYRNSLSTTSVVKEKHTDTVFTTALVAKF